MKKTFVILIMLICFSLSSNAYANMTGSTWNKLNEPAKLFYIVGFYDGFFAFSSAFILGAELPESSNEGIENSLQRDQVIVESGVGDRYSTGLKFEDLLSAINGFYNDYKNINLDFTIAVIAVKMEIKGESADKIDSYLREERRIVHKYKEVLKAKG